MSQQQAQIRCSNCGQVFDAPVHTYIDASQNPEAKTLLLTGRLNNSPCPNCGTINLIASPLLYHDPDKELLVVHVPMELNLKQDEQERIVGDLLNQMPKDNFKGYMFSPKRALTMQGMVEQILEADGITPEMMAEQRTRVDLVQEFLDADSDTLDNLIDQHNDKIDERFFQTMTIMAQRVMESGHTELAQQVIAVQNRLVEKSTYGQSMLEHQETQNAIIVKVSEAIEQLGENATRSDFIDLALRYQDEDDHLQALVALARPAFDYEFFQQLSAHGDSVKQLRDRLVELTGAIDQQVQGEMQQAANALQHMVNMDDPEPFIQANLSYLGDSFMSVLGTNLQEAERNNNTELLSRLRNIYNLVVQGLQAHMQPELLLINELLAAPSDDDARRLLRERVNEFDETLLEVFDAVEDVLTEQNNTDLLGRLQTMRAETATIFA
jgi:hypothetical protein